MEKEGTIEETDEAIVIHAPPAEAGAEGGES